MSIKATLTRQRQIEGRLNTDSSLFQSQKLQRQRSLQEVFNVTYTDYCSLRTKKRLDEIIDRNQFNPINTVFKSLNKTKKTRQNCLAILNTKNITEYTNTPIFFDRTQKARQVKRGKDMTETQMSRDWLSKKIMELELLESKYFQANGHKVMLEKNQRRFSTASKRYQAKSLVSDIEKIPPPSSHILRNRRKKTLFSRTLYQPRERLSSQPQQILNGWQSVIKQFY